MEEYFVLTAHHFSRPNIGLGKANRTVLLVLLWGEKKNRNGTLMCRWCPTKTGFIVMFWAQSVSWVSEQGLFKTHSMRCLTCCNCLSFQKLHNGSLQSPVNYEIAKEHDLGNWWKVALLTWNYSLRPGHLEVIPFLAKAYSAHKFKTLLLSRCRCLLSAPHWEAVDVLQL